MRARLTPHRAPHRAHRAVSTLPGLCVRGNGGLIPLMGHHGGTKTSKKHFTSVPSQMGKCARTPTQPNQTRNNVALKNSVGPKIEILKTIRNFGVLKCGGV